MLSVFRVSPVFHLPCCTTGMWSNQLIHNHGSKCCSLRRKKNKTKNTTHCFNIRNMFPTKETVSHSDISPATRVYLYVLSFSHFLFAFQSQKTQASKSMRDWLCKSKHSTAPLQETNAKKDTMTALQNYSKKIA